MKPNACEHHLALSIRGADGMSSATLIMGGGVVIDKWCAVCGAVRVWKTDKWPPTWITVAQMGDERK